MTIRKKKISKKKLFKPTSDTRQLKLISYEYDEKRKLIIWEVQDLTPGTPPERSVFKLAWLAEDLATQFGFNIKKLSSKIILDFSEQMKNRPWPFNLVLQSTTKLLDPKTIREASETELANAHQNLDQYPFHEVQEKMQEGSL